MIEKTGVLEQGNCIYDKELLEIIEKTKAKGAVLLVFGGERNKNKIEIGVASPLIDLPDFADALILAGLNLRKTCVDMVKEKMGITDDYHKKDGTSGSGFVN